MEFIKNICRKERAWIAAFVFICIAGTWLRIKDFGELLILKSDQARDVLIIKQSLSGSFGALSLLGPQVGGTDFRLGPIFYYFQYLSGKLFNGTTESLFYPDLVFGVLTVPLLFMLFRKFFRTSLSLWITALSSVSLFLITFSRFGWNPNSLPFFTTAFALSFLSALEQKGRRRRILLGLASVSLGVAAQLHLMAILGIGLGLGLFLFLFKPLRWREIALVILIASALHTPVIVHEIRMDGGNIRTLTHAVEKKGTRDAAHAWYEKTFRAYQYDANIAWLTLTGLRNTDTFATKGVSVRCDDACDDALPYSILAMILFGCMLLSAYLRWKSTADTNDKNAVAFVALWMSGFLLMTIPLAYQLETRFFLGIVPMLLVFIGFAVEQFLTAIPAASLRKFAAAFLGIVILLVNARESLSYIHELKVSRVSAQESARDLRFGTAPKVTLGQLRDIAAQASRKFDPDRPVIVTGESLYAKAMYSVLSTEFGYNGCYIKGDDNTRYPLFNHLHIEYHPNRKTPVPFGTLSAAFTASDPPYATASLPKNCLSY